MPQTALSARTSGARVPPQLFYPSYGTDNISNSLLVSVYSYGDRFPQSVGGRLFAVVWILVGICLCSIFTAALTSSLTTLSMETKIALPGTKVLFHSMDKKHSFEIERLLLFYNIVDKRLLSK